MTTEEIKAAILEGLGSVEVEVQDLRGTGDYFRVEVCGSCFEGKSLIEQHRMVKSCVGSALESGEIHALTIKTSKS